MSKFRTFKWVVIITDSISILLALAVYLLPFLHISLLLRKVLAYVFVAGVPIARYIGGSIYARWANAYVHPNKRGSFSAIKEMISLACAIVFSLAAGHLIDKYEAAGNIKGAFLLFAWYIFLSAIFNLVSLLLIKNMENDTVKEAKYLNQVIFSLLYEDKPYQCLLLCESLEYFAINLTVSFLGTYKTIELGYSVWAIQIINSIAMFTRLLLSLPAGIYTDRHSYVKGYLLGLSVLLTSFVLLVFTTPKFRWLLIIFSVLYNVSFCAIGQNRTNMLYDYVPLELFPQALAIKDCIVGVIGFLASLVGSRILIAVQKNNNCFFGIAIYAQQVLSIITCILLVLTILLTYFILSKQPKMHN